MEGVIFFSVFNLWLNGCLYTSMEGLLYLNGNSFTPKGYFYPNGKVIYTPMEGLLIPQCRNIFGGMNL